MENIVSSARKRYATKVFDPSKTIPPDTVQAMKEMLRLSPSSVNSQPWHFIIAETADGKARLAKATEGPFAYNKNKVLNSSHVVVFCSRLDADATYLQRLTDQEASDKRFATDEAKAEQHAKRTGYFNLHKETLKDFPIWAAKQTYLNAGSFLISVASLGLDAVPIEGFDSAVLDQEFGLKAKGFASQVIVAVGYRREDDFNAPLPKSRLPLEETVTTI
jgi:nitroreductase/dihydropteridine reductase